MDSILFVAGAFLAAVILSELALQGAKLQTGLLKVVAVHAATAIALMFYLFLEKRLSFFVPALVFWAGAFLTWFGVRSHMESSILLRMLYLLRGRVVHEAELLREYEAHYGQSQRIAELIRGNLLLETPTGFIVSPKGKFILRIVSFLR